ncbi:hypothetical protein EGW08_004332 [Elysia chlorotica]|uniref:Uncharacterized protein n=1 Tax=Elysia chlorotica TaxID=188477 RepID=A0A433U2A4_ELYCH|nr:hypothetical protein EGW08_004332 [Elysia chlorotica]
MISKVICVVVLGMILAICEAQLPIGVSRQCPKCTDPYDMASCTATTDCYNTEDICELTVDTSDKNRINYFCIHSHACENHENHRCDPTKMDVCSFCCKTVADCKTQREMLFSSTFASSSGASGTTAAAGNSTSP